MYAILTENTNNLKKGDVLKDFKLSTNGIVLNENIVPYENLILLKENLTAQDEAKIKKIVKDILKLVFWRLYTRNSFVLQ
jgi:hypothetical protein